MAEGGGTWKIIVEEGKVSSPTQSNIVNKEKKPTRQKIYSRVEGGEVSRKTANRITTGLAMGVTLSGTAFNHYLSITGQSARKNAFNATITYGTVAASIGLQLARGNVFGAAVATVAGGAVLANQVINFQKNIAEQNASAEYLRQQSNTSVSANRGDLYSFSLF